MLVVSPFTVIVFVFDHCRDKKPGLPIRDTLHKLTVLFTELIEIHILMYDKDRPFVQIHALDLPMSVLIASRFVRILILT